MDSTSRGVLASVQLGADFGDALGQERVGALALDRSRQDGGSGSDRGVGGGGADIGQRVGFGQRDLALGGLGPPRDEILHLGLGFGGNALGFGSRVGNDFLGLAFGAGATRLIFREQFCGFFLEAARIVEFGLDALAAAIERLQHGAMDAEIAEQAHQDDEGDGDPEFPFEEHRHYSFKETSTARPVVLPSGCTPVSRCTIAAAASAAMLRTLLIAPSRVAAMVFSASMSLCVKRCSSVLRSASDAALSFSRVSALIACAGGRAAASSFS